MDNREKLIKDAISHFNYGVTHDIFSEPVTTYAKLASAALEYIRYVHDMDFGKWIPVTERLPEEDGEYLVWFGRNIFEHYAEVRHFAKDGETVDKYDLRHEKNVWYYYDSEWGYVACLNVTHWMPLPEPPKEEQK